MLWSDREWCDRRFEQSEMAARLESAGMQPDGWSNGKPEFTREVDWELVQAVCSGDIEPPMVEAPPAKKEKPQRKTKRGKRG